MGLEQTPCPEKLSLVDTVKEPDALAWARWLASTHFARTPWSEVTREDIETASVFMLEDEMRIISEQGVILPQPPLTE